MGYRTLTYKNRMAAKNVIKKLNNGKGNLYGRLGLYTNSMHVQMTARDALRAAAGKPLWQIRDNECATICEHALRLLDDPQNLELLLQSERN